MVQILIRIHNMCKKYTRIQDLPFIKMPSNKLAIIIKIYRVFFINMQMTDHICLAFWAIVSFSIGGLGEPVVIDDGADDVESVPVDVGSGGGAESLSIDGSGGGESLSIDGSGGAESESIDGSIGAESESIGGGAAVESVVDNWL